MKQIGLTGGIGAGKSTVSKIFNCLGIPVYNSDLKSKKILLSNQLITKKIISILGKSILTSNKIDFKKMSKVIFANKIKLQAINKILHHEVKKDYENWIKKQKGLYIIKESAIIFESKIESNFDKIIFVKSSQKTRINRIIKRDNKNKKEIQNIIKNQMKSKEIYRRSHFTIINEHSNLLIPQVIKIHKKIINF
tara:strand:+ start:483 stop:1064 length:582 start_codon:yes stop_codon:yes gene_type:complete